MSALATIDLRSGFYPVRDMGRLQACTAFAISDAIWWEYRQGRVIGPNFPAAPPSAMFLYYNARKMSGNENHSCPTRPSDNLAALRQFGVCAEHDWPFQAQAFRTRPSQTAYAHAMEHRHVKFEPIDCTLASLRGSLAQSRPVFFCIRIHTSNECTFLDTGAAKAGLIVIPRPGEPAARNHAMLAVGYDDRKGHVIVRNSVGPQWGDEGYGYIPYEYVSNPAWVYGMHQAS